MRSNANISKILIAGAVAFLFCFSAQADVLYSLPETSGLGVNAPSGQTNTAYNACQIGYCSYLFGGDATNTSLSTWDVTSLTVWVVDNENLPATSTGGVTQPSEFATGLTLFGGAISGAGPVFGVATAVATTGYSVTPAPYSGSSNGSNYYSPTTGDYDGVWQVSFNVTGLSILSGEDYFFAVADSSNPLNVSLNATVCTGAAGALPCVSNGIDVADSSGDIIGAYNYADTGGVTSSDVDVELGGSVSTPEPTTLLLFGAGVGVLALVRRRRG
jgi:hypothetical protein